MENETTAHVYPELSTEQKLTVREAQLNVIRVRETAIATIKNAEQALMTSLDKLATELKINVATSTFDLDTLKFSAKK